MLSKIFGYKINKDKKGKQKKKLQQVTRMLQPHYYE